MSYQLHLFTLRLWREVSRDKQNEWRGEIKNTSSGEVHYFRDWQVLIQLLSSMLAEPDDNNAQGDV